MPYFICHLAVCVSHTLSLSLSLISLSYSLDLDPFHSLVYGLQQSLIVRVLVALLVGVHIHQSVHIGVKILLRDWLLLSWAKRKDIC